MRRPPSPRWASEAEMLAAFVADAERLGFTVYPESCGHDLVLRAGPDVPGLFGSDLAEGDLVAVEGKLHPNVAVLAQALPPWGRFYDPCPGAVAADFYAVVVPRRDGEFAGVARALGIVCIVQRPDEGVGDDGMGWDSSARSFRRDAFHFPAEARVTGFEPLELPPPVRMAAGMPAPRAVTPWKVAAVRLCLLGVERGELRSADFIGTPVRAPLFVQRGWMVETAREGRRSVYALVPDAPGRPDLAYPEIAAALAEQAGVAK